jgi:DNA-directed RNA polymerase subunit omega
LTEIADRIIKGLLFFNFNTKDLGLMARITIEDCLEKVENRYELVHLAVKRVKQLREGGEALVRSKNKEVVTALREIAQEKIKHAPVAEYDSDEF